MYNNQRFREREMYYPVCIFSLSLYMETFFSLFLLFFCQVSVVVGVKLVPMKKPKISQTVAF